MQSPQADNKFIGLWRLQKERIKMEMQIGQGTVRVNVMKSPCIDERANINVWISFNGYEYALQDKIATGRVYTVAEEKLYGDLFKKETTLTVSILTRTDTVEFRFSNLLVITESMKIKHDYTYYFDIVSVQEFVHK